MAVKFVKCGGYAELRGDNFEMSVYGYYNNSYPGETYQTQYDRINRLLAGERDLTATFSNCNGESQFTINSSGTFELTGGQADPPFGSRIRIFCNYDDNKEELDKFMRYMLTCVDESDDEDN